MNVDKADVVIVGGGIIGSCSAYYLARAGRDVIVLDPAPGEGASKGNAGIMCPSYCLPMANPNSLRAGLEILRGGPAPVTFQRPISFRTLLWLARFVVACRPGRAWQDAARLHDLARESQTLYDQIIAEESLDLQLRSLGWTYVFHDNDKLRRHIHLAERLTTAGVQHSVFDAATLHQREPAVTPNVAGAVHYPDDRCLNPSQATRAIARAAEGLGARFIRESITQVDRRSSGVQKAWTHNREITASWFVIAAGANSWKVGRQFGVHLPVEAGHGISLTLAAKAQTLIAGALMSGDDHVVISPGADYIRLTSGMEFGGEAIRWPKQAAIVAMRASAERTVPGLRELSRDDEPWRGARPMTPSGVPIIKTVGENLVAAAGHNTMGMTLGPVTGLLVSNQIHANGTRGADAPRSAQRRKAAHD